MFISKLFALLANEHFLGHPLLLMIEMIKKSVFRFKNLLEKKALSRIPCYRGGNFIKILNIIPLKKIVFFISTYSFSHMFCKYTHTVKYFPWEFWGSLKRKLLTWAERSLVLSFTIWQNLLFHSFKNFLFCQKFLVE